MKANIDWGHTTGQVTLTVKVPRIVRLRLRAAIWMIRLASIVGGFGVEVTNER